MKLDLDYVKKLLNTINDCDDDRVSLGYLFENLVTEPDENDMQGKKLRHHLTILRGAGFIMSSSPDLGFRTVLDGSFVCAMNATYWPTMEGYKLLESMNNDTLFNKIKGGLSYFGIETLKQIPALTITLLKEDLKKRFGL